MFRKVRFDLYILCFALLFCNSGYADSSTVDYFSPINIKKFARILFKDKDYRRAAGEYQRYLAIANSDSDSILYQIAVCYELAKDRERAISFYDRLIRLYPNSALVKYSKYQIAANLYHSKQYNTSNLFIEQFDLQAKNTKLQDDFLLLYGLNLIHQNRWNDADTMFDQMNMMSESQHKKTNILKMRNFVKGRFLLKNKQPFLAGLLSAIIPGSGKVYANQSGDGIYSLIIISIAGYLSWDGFRKRGINSGKGWTFATLGGILHLGNIYGSVNAARNFNKLQLNQYIDSINVQIGLYHNIYF